MFTKKSIENQPVITENSNLSSAETARQIEILKRNELVANNDDLAQEIFKSSVMHTCKKGHQIITEGEEKDDVFFLLFGQVSITRKSKEIDTKSAPSNVGELAANTPGDPRTADVSVASETLRMRVISGEKFRRIRDSSAEFEKSLNRFIANMNRAKIAQTTELSEPSILTRAVKPVGIGFVSFVLAMALLSNFSTYTLGQNISLSALAGCAVIGVSTYFDPLHRYGRMFTTSLWALILYIAHFGVSTFIFVDGRSAPVPFFWNFSTNSQQDVVPALAIMFALIVACVICAVADHKRNPSKP